MGILDKVRENKNKELEKDKPTLPPHGHTLKEVLGDKSKSRLFYELLKLNGEEELAKRLIQNKLEDGDVELLEAQREIFSKKTTSAEKIEKSLTREKVIELASKSPDFAKIVKQLTPEGAMRVIVSQLNEIAITDESRFNALVSFVETKESYENGEYKKVSDEVEELLKENDITSKEYLDILAIKDASEKRKALAKLSGKGRWFGRVDKSLLSKLENSEVAIEDSISQLDLLSSNVGDILFRTVNQNEDMRRALSSELVGEKMPKESQGGFKEAKKDLLIEGEYDEDWKIEKKNTNYETKSSAEKKTIRKDFSKRAKEYYKKKHEGEGFLNYIVSIMIEGFINDKKLE